jgi:hypothetical protein
MPQDNAASGLIGGAIRLRDKAQNLINKIPTYTPKQDTTWHDQMVKSANESFVKQAQKQTTTPAKPTSKPTAKPSSYKKGGTVQKTGMAKVHKGEKVLTVAQVKAAKKKKKK